MKPIQKFPAAMIFFALTNALLTAGQSTTTIRTQQRVDVTGNGTTKPIVFLTVSSLASKHESDRRLEMNWENVPSEDYNANEVFVNLYDADPSENPEKPPLVSVRPVPKGYFRTSVHFPRHTFTRQDLTRKCLGFWIAYVKSNRIETTNCIRTEPRWMSESRDAIGNLSLLDLMIPGTHNTGSFTTFNPRDDSIFNKYLFTQDEDIWNQLVYGVRYLDLRVSHYKSQRSREVYWITHSTFRTNITVRDVFRQVKQFLDATNEIVIMDFHRFVLGFQNRRTSLDRHKDVVDMLEEELGDYLIPIHYTSRASLNHLWGSNKRLYVGYAERVTRSRSIHLFPAIRHLWGDVDSASGLLSYLNSTVCSSSNQRLTSAMAQLTPKTSGVIFNSYGGLRVMADEVNRLMTKQFRYQWNQCANIIATDYFMGNNIVELAIETNRKRVPTLNMFPIHRKYGKNDE